MLSGNSLLLIFYKNMKKIIFITVLAFSLLLPFTPNTQAAGLLNSQTKDQVIDNGQVMGAEAGYGSTPVIFVIESIIKIVLGLLAIIFVVLLIIAGFKWMTAQGNEDDVKHAKASIKTAIIGLVIVLAAYGITFFVFKYLGTALSFTNTNSGGNNLGSGGQGGT